MVMKKRVCLTGHAMLSAHH